MRAFLVLLGICVGLITHGVSSRDYTTIEQVISEAFTSMYAVDLSGTGQ